MNKLWYVIIIFFLLTLGGVVYAAPAFNYSRGIVPELDSTYELGSTTLSWLKVHSDEYCLQGDCITAWPVGGGGGGAGGGWSTSTPNIISTNWLSTTNALVGINSSTPKGILVVKGISGTTTPVLLVTSSTNSTLFRVDGNGSTTIPSLGAGFVKSTSGGGLYIDGSTYIYSLGGQTGATQTFSTSTTATGLVLNITSATNAHNWALSLATGYNIPLTASTTEWASAQALSHSPVTLAGENYLSLSGQQITAADVNLTSNVTGVLPIANGGTATTSAPTVAGQLLTSHGTSWGVGNLVAGSNITITTSTLGQITITGAAGGSGNSAWTIGNGLIYNATTTDSVLVGTTTPTTAKLFVQGNGAKNALVIASSSGTTQLTIDTKGNITQNAPYSKFGDATPLFPLAGPGLELWCDDNSINGCLIGTGNRNAGTSAYTGFFLNNNIANAAVTNYAGMFLNSSTYTDTTFGTAISAANQFVIQNTMGPLTISSATSGAGEYISFLTGGNTTGNERMRITESGLLGINTTSPIATLTVRGTSTLGTTRVFHVASSSGATYMTVTSGGNVGIGSTTPQSPFVVIASTTGVSGLVVDSQQRGTFYVPMGNNRRDVIIGVEAGPARDFIPTSGSYAAIFSNTLIGYRAGKAIVASSTGDCGGGGSGCYDIAYGITAIGNQALASCVTCQETVAVGNLALVNATGFGNVAVGLDAGRGVTSGTSNVAVGNDSMVTANGTENVYLGAGTAFSSTGGDNNVAVGNGAMFNQSGSNNIVIGHKMQLPTTSSANMLNIGSLLFGTGLTTHTALGWIGDGAGRIGIGTSTPIAKLSVKASTTDATIPIFLLASSSGSTVLRVNPDGQTILNNLQLSNVASGTQCLQADSSGNVTGTGSLCGSGGGGSGGAGWSTSTPNIIYSNYPSSTTTIVGINSSSPIATLAVKGISGSTTPVFLVASSSGSSALSVLPYLFGTRSAMVTWLRNNATDTPALIVGPSSTPLSGLGMAEFHTFESRNILVVSAHGPNSNDATPGINTYQSRGTYNNPSATQVDDVLYLMGGRGYGATGYGGGTKVAINMKAAQTWTDTGQGTYIAFETTPILSTTRAERMRVFDSGQVGINTTSPLATLGIQGIASGSLASLTVASSSGTTLFQITANAQILNCATCRLTIPQGTAPTLTAAGDVAVDTSNGGMFSFYANGRENLVATSSKAVFIENPSASEDIILYRAEQPTTITKVTCVIRSAVSNVPSWTFSMPHDTSVAAAGANAMTTGQTCTNTTTPSSITIGGDITLAAGEVLRATSSAVSNASSTFIQFELKFDN